MSDSQIRKTDSALRGPGVHGEPAPSVAERLSALEWQLMAEQAVLDERLLRVENNRLFSAWRWIVAHARRLIQRADPNWGRRAAEAALRPYPIWVAHEQAGLPGPEQTRAAILEWKRQPLFSVLIPPSMDEQSRAQLMTALETQVWPFWEACVAAPDAGRSEDQTRIRGIEISAGISDAEALNKAAREAQGDYLIFCTGEAYLSPFAFYFLAESLQRGDVDLLYGDEDQVDAAGTRLRPWFKPGWSPDLLRSCMYPGRFVAVRRSCFLALSGLRAEAGSAFAHDLALRLADQQPSVRHVARVLCHARSSVPYGPGRPDGGPVDSDAREACAIICSRSPELLEKCLRSLRATGGALFREFVVVAHEESGPNARLRQVAASAGAKVVPFSGPFNFSAMNNLGAARASAPLLFFVNDDIVATGSGWARELTSHLGRPGTGIVGATLRYPDGAIQHAGVVTGIWDGAAHAGRGATESLLWPWLLMTRNVSAVTGAFLGIRAEVFRELGGFDPLFPNNYNDVDLCLRARKRGYEVVCVGVEGLVHAECRTRRGVVRYAERRRFFRRWAEALRRPDPYYSTSLGRTERIELNLSQDGG